MYCMLCWPSTKSQKIKEKNKKEKNHKNTQILQYPKRNTAVVVPVGAVILSQRGLQPQERNLQDILKDSFDG